MFPIHFKLTVGTVAELNALNAFINATYAANVASAPKLVAEPVVEVAAAPVEKPKGKRSQAQTEVAPTPVEPTSPPAPTSPTAEAVVVAAPEKTVVASAPSAAPAEAQPQPSTAVADAPFEYATLQKLVFKLLPDHGAKLLEVSVKHGAAKFKELPASAWKAAHDDLIATYGG